jgi:peroxiredoxin
MNNDLMLAPELEVTDWLNTPESLKLSELRGKVVVLHAFQMLCPGCVLHGIPQATSIYDLFNSMEVQVIGLHTVFEHHDVLTKDTLLAFVHEYQIRFPIAIDKAATSGAIPLTMKKYHLKGTPSLVLIDQYGKIRLNHFGQLSDMRVGNAIGQLLSAGM